MSVERGMIKFHSSTWHRHEVPNSANKPFACLLLGGHQVNHALMSHFSGNGKFHKISDS